MADHRARRAAAGPQRAAGERRVPDQSRRIAGFAVTPRAAPPPRRRPDGRSGASEVAAICLGAGRTLKAGPMSPAAIRKRSRPGARRTAARRHSVPPTPRVGLVSLGCPKAMVDSERIITRLRAEGYQLSADYAGADVVVVNTCGFLNSAKQESLDAIGEAVAENGRVVVTGCFGVEKERIFAAHPDVLAVTGPHQYEEVVAAVHAAVPPLHDPFLDLVPPEGLRLTPRHYAYLKISEGCNNRCSFCIIPQLRGRLASRPAAHVMAEAERLVAAGVKE